MWGVLGQGCPPAWGLPIAWLSVGYLFIIYGVWSSPRTWREQEDSAGGTHRVPPGSHQHILALLVSRMGLTGPWLWQVAVGAGTGLGGAGGPVTVCVSPWGTQRCPGGAFLQVSTQRCLQAFLPLPVQPFSLLALAPHPWATGAGRGGEEGPGVPLGRAGDALSLLLPFNKLVFL
ncbi:hypothetical protein Nmel_014856 [Mimus melanotis]